jgi:hypothetical protein
LTILGTPQVAFANSIARNGPDLSRAGSTTGTALGAGFYTDTNNPYPESIAGPNGSLLMCTVAPGKIMPGANSSTTASSLRSAGFDSVTNGSIPPWHVMFHPDAVVVDYIIGNYCRLSIV